MRNLRKHIIYVCFTAFMSVTSWAVADDKPACYHQAIGGDKEAQYQLAEIYRIGKEIEQDWKLAFQWLKNQQSKIILPQCMLWLFV